MKCEQIREQLLDAPTDEVRAHLAACPECERVWSQMQSTMALLDEWAAPAPSPFFDTKFRARLAEVKAEEATRPGWLTWLRRSAFAQPMWRPLTVGALGVVMVFGVSLLNDSDRPNKTVIVTSAPGTAVSDLQALEKNQDAISDLELLDDLTLDEAGQVEDNL